MKAIIIAAGACKRLRPLTDNLPKCMLKINGKTIIENMLDIFKSNDIEDISIIRGYMGSKIDFQNITYFENDDFMNNNILHSLMYSRDKLVQAMQEGEEVIISYSDIVYEESVLNKLIKSKANIAAVVDIDWMDYYDGRSDHPITQAEKALFDENYRMIQIGKHILNDLNESHISNHGEFLGLFKLSPEGIRTFLAHFDRLNSTYSKYDSFHNAKEWQKSYITDFFQEMVDMNEDINCVTIKKGWKEFDTVQDFLRAGGEIPK
jgi:L-glutamine-phosphate cytidylyltransferase